MDTWLCNILHLDHSSIGRENCRAQSVAAERHSADNFFFSNILEGMFREKCAHG
jgi:hypothetical protein